jgi:predicted nucleic acid-binding protein
MISYWDTSALIPCFVSEQSTPEMLNRLKEGADSVRFTSWLTVFEFEGVLRRKLNQKLVSQREYEAVQERWAELQQSLNFIPLDSRSARTGLRFQKLYQLRPYDSIQLGSASLVQLDYPELEFLCLDEKLSRLAKQEGMRTL